jgi:hypothetical protein
MTTLLLSLMLFAGQSRPPGQFTVYGSGLQPCRWTRRDNPLDDIYTASRKLRDELAKKQ